MMKETLEDSQWFRTQIQEKFSASKVPKGIWVMVSSPWKQLKQLSGPKRLRAIPASLIRTALNLVVALGAAFDIKKGKYYW
jgi:hypothetical protein